MSPIFQDQHEETTNFQQDPVKVVVTVVCLACVVYLVAVGLKGSTMSQEYYQQQWKDAQNILKKNLAADANIKKKGPVKDPNTAKWLVGHLFMNYVMVVNKLDDCYDQMIHPQKREVIGRLLDLSLGRLLELKSEIVRLELDDYCFFDNILVELKLTHKDMEIKVPQYFWREREKAKAHRRKLIKQVFDEAEREKFKIVYLQNIPEEAREEAWDEYLRKEEQQRLEKEKFEEQQRKLQADTLLEKDSLEQLKQNLKKIETVDKEAVTAAISLIQRHERARQGRVQTLLAKRRKALKEKGEVGPKIPEEKAHAAAKVIQTHWRRYRRRKKEQKTKLYLQGMLGMTQSSQKASDAYQILENIAMIRRKMQDRNQKEYDEALVKVKEKVTLLYSIPMEEDIVDEIMAWFQWYQSQCNYLPDFPPDKPVVPTGEIMGIPKKLGPSFADKLFPPGSKNKTAESPKKKASPLAVALAGISAIAGSALVVAGHWIEPKDFLRCQMELEKMKKDGKKGGEKKEKMSKEEKMELKKKEKEAEKRRLLAEEAEGFRLRDSTFVTPLVKADRDYRVVWMDRDESKNYEQRYIYDFVKDEKCYELSMEVRAVVDEMMRLELELLQDALERDKNPKKKKKKKKPKNKKEKKKKGKKDPTGDRTTEDLFIELFKNGIIREYEEVHLKDYFGERSYGAFDMRQKMIDWPPSSGDVRELILQLCILPLGSSRVHQLGPLVKSICLLGTENSAKEYLARVICTETASVMFDLTPANVADKYPGKDGLKMLQHLIEKMSRILQPSVIFIEGAEKTFYKKVPKEEKALDPKRLSKIIPKIVKGIKPEDQVLLLGVSSQPWLAQKKKFLKTFQQTIQVPQMDYGSYVKLWRDLLAPYHSVPRDFDVSCLARVSDGFSVKTISDAVANVLTTERITQSRYKPYTQVEFLEELLKSKPIDPKIKDKSLKFYAGLDMPKKKTKKLMEMKEELERAQKKK